MLKNPLREEPRSRRAGVIRSNNESSMLEWLESKGRIIGRGTQDPDYKDEEEISELMESNDIPYEEEDDSQSLDD